ISTGTSENKFGIGLDRLAATYEAAARMPNIRIAGLQMHIGSQITEAKPFAEAIQKLLPLARDLTNRYGMEFFSIGGGMGIIYRRALESGSGKWWHEHDGEPSAFSVSDYANAIVPPLRDLNIRVLIEPGRFLVGNAGALLTRVLYLKKSGTKTFAITDAGMNDLIRPALYQGYHEIVPVEKSVGEAASFPPSNSKVDIVGPVCESGDFFAHDREMPEPHEGHLLAIMSAGAYGFVMASNYNSRPLPAEVLVRGKQVSLIRKRQTWEDLVRDEA
ncbi:MAG TPA: diaminopimelate decarboxylase, partial [Chthoniobacterales bacterium]|nr:diaminopimelate decarboxylase [Chthoniobacterales bacterium]